MVDEPPLLKAITAVTDKVVGHAVEDPLGTLANLDSASDLLVKVLPASPWESPIPIPRVLYEKLMKK